MTFNKSPEYLILDIDYQVSQIAIEMQEMISDLLAIYASHLLNTGVEQNFFIEVVRQVFDYMTDDFVTFQNLVNKFPNFSRFQHVQLYILNNTTQNEIAQFCRTIATGLFFQMRNLGLFNTSVSHGFHFILREAGETHILLERTPEVHFGTLS